MKLLLRQEIVKGIKAYTLWGRLRVAPLPQSTAAYLCTITRHRHGSATIFWCKHAQQTELLHHYLFICFLLPLLLLLPVSYIAPAPSHVLLYYTLYHALMPSSTIVEWNSFADWLCRFIQQKERKRKKSKNCPWYYLLTPVSELISLSVSFILVGQCWAVGSAPLQPTLSLMNIEWYHWRWNNGLWFFMQIDADSTRK